jgi:hypothetical protein
VRRNPKPRAANLARQLVWLQAGASCGEGSLRRSRLLWRVTVQPGALTATYRIEISYRLGERPRVFVLEPGLRTLDGKGAPHRFEDGSLCLNVHGEWRPDMSLATTILPWAVEWLLHYEVWLATGEWQGGGVSHGPQPKTESAA